MKTLIHERLETARAGTNPTVICRLKSGWVVLGDYQNLKGYCVLLADPVISSINNLSKGDRIQFSLDMYAVGDALLTVTNSFRINYSILGNKDAALHAHITPRYLDEPDETRGKMLPPRFKSPVLFDAERDGKLMKSIQRVLKSDPL